MSLSSCFSKKLVLLVAWTTMMVVTANGKESSLRLHVYDADSHQRIAARVYLSDSSGKAYFLEASEPDGKAVRYEKQNWINAKSIEYHTTVSAHPSMAQLEPGRYRLTVESGKCYRSVTREVVVDQAMVEVEVLLQRWSDPEARQWYSGDTHLHRTVDELRTVILAEDLNVALPLTSWVTYSSTPPSSGDKNVLDAQRSGLIEVDSKHVIWPRNTEYEIFTVEKKQHTLGALFVLGHRESLSAKVPPWSNVVDSLRQSDPQVLYDMDKLDWPFAMLLPTLVPGALYELSNNHTWRTEFAFRDWNTTAPPYMQPPWGAKSGGHRSWLDYTHGMYYTLLNTGLRLPPSGGTASGVHPVPAGFGRVYVHLPNGFQYDDWMEGLRTGRSFVTTGPMLYATASGNDPGHVFRWDAGEQKSLSLDIEVQSEEPILYGEVLINGKPEHLLYATNEHVQDRFYRTKVALDIQPRRSGWFAIRFWEKRSDGQVRFVHSAPWYVEIDAQPVRIARQEKEYLIERVRAEIERSQGVVSAEAMSEYKRGLEFYRQLPEVDDQEEVNRVARPMVNSTHRDRWLDNMIVDHGFTAQEVRLATGMSSEECEREVAQRGPRRERQNGALSLLPYPGGRHPRIGFLDGALDPQRETKVSIFPPWENGGYVVVDVPEAIFSNLGLTYLAHTHVPTIWDNAAKPLEKLEWEETESGFKMNRLLPNGIVFESTVERQEDRVAMRIELTNGTEQKLTGLRVQVCTMLKGAVGFNLQEPMESIVESSRIAVRAPGTNRWIITRWTPTNRVWQNPPVPCIHVDPIFPDCEPGKTVVVEGEVSFYEGKDIRSYLDNFR